MTYIEFLDKAQIENIAAALITPPERIILVGSREKILKLCASRYEKILKERGYSVSVLYRLIPCKCFTEILTILSEIVEQYEDCVFDLTGGDDIFLVAVGILLERYGEKKLHIHCVNIKEGGIQNCDLNGKVIAEQQLPQISVAENIRIYGGEVVWEKTKRGGTPEWELSDALCRDIERLWSVCRRNVKRWNVQVGLFALAEGLRLKGDDPMLTVVPAESYKKAVNKKGLKDLGDKYILKALVEQKLVQIQELTQEKEKWISIRYKNAEVKKCLTKAGQVLEMIVYFSAVRAKKENGAPIYNDVKNGVLIDWDGKLHDSPEGNDTANEIDVLMMYGMVPIFVSCKNGHVETDELYKLATVAARFGGKYAQKVLVATALGKGAAADHVRERAKDMKIKLIENLQALPTEERQTVIGNFWNG